MGREECAFARIRGVHAVLAVAKNSHPFSSSSLQGVRDVRPLSVLVRCPAGAPGSVRNRRVTWARSVRHPLPDMSSVASHPSDELLFEPNASLPFRMPMPMPMPASIIDTLMMGGCATLSHRRLSAQATGSRGAICRPCTSRTLPAAFSMFWLEMRRSAVDPAPTMALQALEQIDSAQRSIAMSDPLCRLKRSARRRAECVRWLT